MKFCKNCGKQLEDNDQFCPNCGANQESTADIVNNNASGNNGGAFSNVSDRSRIVAALLACFLGYLGIHNFYLGNKKTAVTQLILTCFCFLIIPIIISCVWAFVDFILILCGTCKDGEGKVVSSWKGRE